MKTNNTLEFMQARPSRGRCSVSALLAAGLLVMGASTANAAALPPESEQASPTDCTAVVGYKVNTTLPGYLVRDGVLGTSCVPFTQVALAPAGYQGDFRVQEFSDEAARRALAACEAQPPCSTINAIRNYAPQPFRATGMLVPEGRIDPHAFDVDLRQIRRPAFFGRAPYGEPIAQAERRTHTFEFTVPPEPYERLNRGLTAPVKLRGWYMRGTGVQDGQGRRVHALVIFIGGRSIETTAVQDPRDPLYTRSASTGNYVPVSFPARGTEKWGTRLWREYLDKLNQAGFDVLTFDKRGHGISGGITPDNTLQQGLDMLRAIQALETGDGVRTLGPDGVLRAGFSAVRELTAPGQVRHMPIVLGGPSQGSWTTQWAMNANFNTWCELDLPDRPCHQPWGIQNIKGAVLLASMPPGLFNQAQDLVIEAARRKLTHVVLRPTSEAVAGIGSWPAVFFGKGLWDENQGPFPTFNAYLRVRGARELLFVRGPHSENEFGPGNVALMQERVTQFAVNVVLGRPSSQPPFSTLKDAIAASPSIWEVSTQPAFESSP
jgi:pimeloyl-ACP methyl ester carboxylesterase